MKCYFRLYSSKNWEFWTCQLAICDGRRPRKGLGLSPNSIIIPSVKRWQSVEHVFATGEVEDINHSRIRHLQSLWYLYWVKKVTPFRAFLTTLLSDMRNWGARYPLDRSVLDVLMRRWSFCMR
ncbi:hypothetical protein TNCV_4254641 [Trichonephila clavipes]|nr:hypothetical protein TNCV_4254641 [Trichonephila clavipes]